MRRKQPKPLRHSIDLVSEEATTALIQLRWEEFNDEDQYAEPFITVQPYLSLEDRVTVRYYAARRR